MDDELWMLLFQISFILFILFIYISHHMFVHNVILRDWRKFFVKIGEKKITTKLFPTNESFVSDNYLYFSTKQDFQFILPTNWTFFEVKFASLISRYRVYTTRVKINIIKCHVYSIHSKKRKNNWIEIPSMNAFESISYEKTFLRSFECEILTHMFESQNK